jgi:hypothetical protein
LIWRDLVWLSQDEFELVDFDGTKPVFTKPVFSDDEIEHATRAFRRAMRRARPLAPGPSGCRAHCAAAAPRREPRPTLLGPAPPSKPPKPPRALVSVDSEPDTETSDGTAADAVIEAGPAAAAGDAAPFGVASAAMTRPALVDMGMVDLRQEEMRAALQIANRVVRRRRALGRAARRAAALLLGAAARAGPRPAAPRSRGRGPPQPPASGGRPCPTSPAPARALLTPPPTHTHTPRRSCAAPACSAS